MRTSDVKVIRLYKRLARLEAKWFQALKTKPEKAEMFCGLMMSAWERLWASRRSGKCVHCK